MTPLDHVRLQSLREDFPGVAWVAEHRFDDSRKWRFDFAAPEVRIAIEVEGGTRQGGRHNRHEGFVNDLEKYNRAIVLGWRLLRAIPRDFDNGVLRPSISEILRAAE